MTKPLVSRNYFIDGKKVSAFTFRETAIAAAAEEINGYVKENVLFELGGHEFQAQNYQWSQLEDQMLAIVEAISPDGRFIRIDGDMIFLDGDGEFVLDEWMFGFIPEGETWSVHDVWEYRNNYEK